MYRCTSYLVRCTMYDVPMYKVRCTLYMYIPCTMYFIVAASRSGLLCTSYVVQVHIYYVHRTSYLVRGTLYLVPYICTSYIVLVLCTCTMYDVHRTYSTSTMYIVHMYMVLVHTVCLCTLALYRYIEDSTGVRQVCRCNTRERTHDEHTGTMYVHMYIVHRTLYCVPTLYDVPCTYVHSTRYKYIVLPCYLVCTYVHSSSRATMYYVYIVRVPCTICTCTCTMYYVHRTSTSY